MGSWLEGGWKKHRMKKEPVQKPWGKRWWRVLLPEGLGLETWAIAGLRSWKDLSALNIRQVSGPLHRRMMGSNCHSEVTLAIIWLCRSNQKFQRLVSTWRSVWSRCSNPVKKMWCLNWVRGSGNRETWTDQSDACNRVIGSLDQSLDLLAVASEREQEDWDYSWASDLRTWMDGVILEEGPGWG